MDFPNNETEFQLISQDLVFGYNENSKIGEFQQFLNQYDNFTENATNSNIEQNISVYFQNLMNIPVHIQNLEYCKNFKIKSQTDLSLYWVKIVTAMKLMDLPAIRILTKNKLILIKILKIQNSQIYPQGKSINYRTIKNNSIKKISQKMIIPIKQICILVTKIMLLLTTKINNFLLIKLILFVISTNMVASKIPSHNLDKNQIYLFTKKKPIQIVRIIKLMNQYYILRLHQINYLSITQKNNKYNKQTEKNNMKKLNKQNISYHQN
ncbi:hypothetical protein ABPG74_019934 [Tetrahymena malaccensis]